jgi:hypothetical protein
MPTVRDDPESPDPGFAELYASLPDAARLEPWLGWAKGASPPVLYLGIGTGRLAVPLAREGIELLGVDSHPGMLERLRLRLPGTEQVEARIEALDLQREFDLVMVPSNILCTAERLRAAARHVAGSGRLAFQLMNPHWLAAGPSRNVRVISLNREEARIDVAYPNGTVQEAQVPLVWPEDIEDFLGEAGLELLSLSGEPEAELAESPTFYVLSSKRLRRAQIPST